MCMCVTLSAMVTLIFLFFPKLYIIVFRPEKNNRALFTTSKSIRCHIGARVATALTEKVSGSSAGGGGSVGAGAGSGAPRDGKTRHSVNWNDEGKEKQGKKIPSRNTSATSVASPRLVHICEVMTTMLFQPPCHLRPHSSTIT